MSTAYEKRQAARERLQSREAMVEFNARAIADGLLDGKQPSEIELKVYAQVKQQCEDAKVEFRQATDAFIEYCESQHPIKRSSAAGTAKDLSTDASEGSQLQETVIVEVVDARLTGLRNDARKKARDGSFLNKFREVELRGELVHSKPGLIDTNQQLSEQDCLHGDKVLESQDLSLKVGGGSDLSVGNLKLHEQKLVSLHNSSLSVDDAPQGAVGGTSDSTERVQTPGLPEMKMPSAAATAEGDETKTTTD